MRLVHMRWGTALLWYRYIKTLKAKKKTKTNQNKPLKTFRLPTANNASHV